MSTLQVTDVQASTVKNPNTTNGGVAIDSSGHVQVDGLQIPTAGPLSNRNRIINGDMRIDQRNAGASFTPGDGAYSVDRWEHYQSPAGKYSVQQNSGSVTPPAGFSYYLGIVSASAYTSAADDYFSLQQTIEGYNVADLEWGTANAKTVTVSFWVRSSLTGTFGGSLKNLAANATRSYPFTFAISAANTWEHKTITVAGDTTGTWGTTNGDGICLSINLGTGTTYSGTAGAWASSNYLSATGAVSLVGTSGATLYLTGVQLEVGEKATPFEHRSYGDELARCQRYFHKSFQQNTAPTQNAGLSGGAAFISTTAGLHEITYFYPVPLRAIPTTITTYSPNAATSNWSTNGDSPSASIPLSGEGRCTIRADAPAAAGRLYAIHLTADAEL